jgi:hypothetical protein
VRYPSREQADGEQACPDRRSRAGSCFRSDLASVQLDELALAHDGLPWITWKEAVLAWHLQRLATARAEAWIPGLAGRHEKDPAVTKFLNRFYRHHMLIAIRRLRAENIQLRRKIVDASKCTPFDPPVRLTQVNVRPLR